LHLGLSYKEIAQLLNISHTSVHTKKYRLNKKVALPSDMDLLAWLYRVANDAKS
jgi:DNA-binding CsgD family transcriptional regulator